MLRPTLKRIAATFTTIAFLLLVLVLYTIPSPVAAPQVGITDLTPYAYLPNVRSAPTPTATTLPAIIRVVYVYVHDGILPKVYEYVEIQNQGLSPQVMTGWKLKNENGGEVYTFPVFTLQPGNSVKVYSRTGKNSATELFWGHRDHNFPIWDHGDRACVYRADWVQVHCMIAP